MTDLTDADKKKLADLAAAEKAKSDAAQTKARSLVATEGSVDFTDVIDVVTDLKGGNVGAAVSWLFRNKEKLGGLVGFLKGIGQHLGIGKKKTEQADHGPTTVPTVAPPAPTTPVPVLSVPREARRVAGLRLTVMGIEIPKSDKPGTGQRLLNKLEFDKVMSGADPIDAGSRIHTDCTPFDQYGVAFQPGDPANASELLFDPNGPQEWANFRLKDVIFEDHGEGTGEPGGFTEPTSNYDDFGCTTVFKVSRGIPNGEQHTLRFAKRYVKKDITQGEVILFESNVTQEIRVKPWVTA